jgi:SAM-dependent methyltransferase
MAPYNFVTDEEKLALDELLPIIEAGGNVLDLGCGGKKIHEKVTGVDLRRNGEIGVGGNSETGAVADITADICALPVGPSSVDAILAKHVFEHILDPIAALKEWKRVLKNNGALVILCPDYRRCEAISVDPSHVHAYTPESVSSLLEVSGFGVVKVEQVPMGYVFCVSARKVPTLEIQDAYAPEHYKEVAECL